MSYCTKVTNVTKNSSVSIVGLNFVIHNMGGGGGGGGGYANFSFGVYKSLINIIL